MMHRERTPRKRDDGGADVGAISGARPRSRRRARRGLLALVCVLGAGCPSRFDLRADPVARAADPAAQASYLDARARFDAGRMTEAREGFRKLRVEHAADPIVASATLWEARADLSLGEAPAAVPILEPLAAAPGGDPVGERARFLLGLALGRMGDAARARQLLLPFVALVSGSEEAVEMHAALATAAATLGNTAEALGELEAFYPAARPVERAYIRDRAGALAAGLTDAEVLRLHETLPAGGLATAVIDPRAATLLGAVDASAARTILDGATAARRRFGYPEAAVVEVTRVVRAVGLVLPLSGRNHLVGERALRGALLAAGSLPDATEEAGVRASPSPAVELWVRDTASQPERAAAAVDELARAGVAAIVGSPDRSEAAALLGRSAATAIPVIDLSSDEGAREGLSFKLVRPNAARAAALAELAMSLHHPRTAVFYPDNAYGRKMADAWSATIEGRGGTVLAKLAYDEKTTTFIKQAKTLAGLTPDVVFVPAPAAQLELIAAQLAASGVTRRAAARKSAHRSSEVTLLYATADGLTPKLLARAGSYLEGAVIAPVYYPSDELAPLVQRFRDAYGDEPGAADALAWDAVTALRSALGPLPNEAPELRARVVESVIAARAVGLTGELGFETGGERAGAPRLFAVAGDQIRPIVGR